MAYNIPMTSRDRDALIEALTVVNDNDVPVWVVYSLTDLIDMWDRKHGGGEIDDWG